MKINLGHSSQSLDRTQNHPTKQPSGNQDDQWNIWDPEKNVFQLKLKADSEPGEFKTDCKPSWIQDRP